MSHCDLNATHLRYRKYVANRSQCDIALRHICDLNATSHFNNSYESRQVTQLRYSRDIAMRHRCDFDMNVALRHICDLIAISHCDMNATRMRLCMNVATEHSCDLIATFFDKNLKCILLGFYSRYSDLGLNLLSSESKMNVALRPKCDPSAISQIRRKQVAMRHRTATHLRPKCDIAFQQLI